MNDEERGRLVSRIRNVNNLSSNDVHELKNIVSVGLRPYKDHINNFLDKAHGNDDAVILKVALKGEGSLSNNERFRLEEAIKKRGRRRL